MITFFLSDREISNESFKKCYLQNIRKIMIDVQQGYEYH